MTKTTNERTPRSPTSYGSPEFRFGVRLTVIACLLFTAILVGIGSYWILWNVQNKAQQDQYNAFAKKIASSTLSAILDKQDALTTGLALILQYCPHKSDWPYCRVPFAFYQSILNPLHRITQTRSLAFSIKVEPEEALAFEKFAYLFYAEEGHPELARWNSGIFDVNRTNGERIHDVYGTSGHGKYNMLLPILQATDLEVNAEVMLFNTYSQHSRVNAIDYAFDCIQKYPNSTPWRCTAITNIIQLMPDIGKRLRPASLTLLPITPIDAKSTVVGMIGAVHNWDTVLNMAANEQVDGIMAVLSDGLSSHSYLYEKGQVTYLAPSDLHSSRYENQKISFSATPFGGPNQYTLTLYPTKEWMDHYVDHWPLLASLTMVGLVASTSLVFCFYDYLMNREMIHKDLMIQMKRQYVRYISHEIRTPLNVVHLGFQVLFHEMKKARAMWLSKSSMPPHAEPNSEPLLRHDPGEHNIGLASEDSSISMHSRGSCSSLLESELSSETKSSSQLVLPNFLAVSPVSEEQSVCIPLDKADSVVTLVDEWIPLVQDIVESANAAIAILSDLIDYDKIYSGTMNLQLEALPVWSFLETCVHPFIVQARAKDIDMVIQHSCTDIGGEVAGEELVLEDLSHLVMLADRVKFGQVMRNLVSNALKFTPSGGKVAVNCCFHIHSESQIESHGVKRLPKIEESTKTKLSSLKLYPCGLLKLSVSDTGVGMTPEQVKQLFREGVQFNPNTLQAGQGSGLGLWITKGIVDSHGGTVTASSPGEGHGSTFTVSLPLYSFKAKEPPDLCHQAARNSKRAETQVLQGRPAVQGTLSKESPPTFKVSQHRFRNVLVTDDSAVNRKMMCRSLKSIGLQCFQAVDGQECLDIIQKALHQEHESIDLVLMDYEMPRMNGPTATAAIRDMRCNIPVIGITGNVLQEDKQLFLEHGAVHVLQKPFSLTELQDILIHI